MRAGRGLEQKLVAESGSGCIHVRRKALHAVIRVVAPTLHSQDSANNMPDDRYVLTLAVLGRTPVVEITQAEYEQMKLCNPQVYGAFEIELALDFVVLNYIDIEKYVAAHLVDDMVGRMPTEDSLRARHWGFTRVLSNWLASVTFWQDLSENRLIKICGRGVERDQIAVMREKFMTDHFEFAFIKHLRNYSQHIGFPISSSSLGSWWNDEGTELTFTADYKFDYEYFRSYFEGRLSSKDRKAFGVKLDAHCGGQPIDLKPIVRRSMGIFGLFMDEIRAVMAAHVSANEHAVLEMIERYRAVYPDGSISGLSVMPLDERDVVKNKEDIIPVRDEFIVRAQRLRSRNNSKTLANIEKRVASNA